MNSALRRIALLVAVVAATPLSSLAQSCVVPDEIRIDWLGAYTGCKRGSGTCAVGEPITFSVTGAPGVIPACATYNWSFDDSTTSNAANPIKTFFTAGSIGAFVTVHGSNSAVDGAQVVVAQTVLPSVQSFTVSPGVVAPGQSVVFTWKTTNAPKGVRIESNPPSLKVTVPTGTQYTHTPTKGASYTLTAIGDAAQVPYPTPVTVVVMAHRRASRH